MTTMWTTAVLAPLLTVLALAVVGLQPSDPSGERARARLARVAPWTTLPALGLCLAGPAAGRVELPGLLLGTTLEVDDVARPLLLAVVLIYLAALWTTAARRTRRSPLLSATLLVCYLGNLVALVAADAVTFYAGFAVMSFAAYGLVVHRGTGTARHAGRVYLVLTVISEVLVLVALMFVATAGGRQVTEAPAALASSPHTSLIVVLLLLGLGIKAGAVPMHVWVAPAHSSAPTAVSPVLSGLLVKIGIVGWLRFLPLGEIQLSGAGYALVALGLLGMFLAVPAALLQNDAKVVLAYSTVSQLGVLSVLVGAALAEPALAPAGTVAAVLYMVHHGLAKATLFLGVPLWLARGATRGWVALGSAGAALAIAGAPLTTGFLAKYAAKEAVYDIAGLAAALTVLGAGSTMVLARAIWLLQRDPKDPAADVSVEDEPGPLAQAQSSPARPDPREAAEAHPAHSSPAALTAWSMLAVAAAGVPWLLALTWLTPADRRALTGTDLWAAAWPVTLGLVLSTAGWWLARHLRRLSDPPVVPAGDLLVAMEAAAHAAVTGGRTGQALVGQGYRSARDGAARAATTLSPPAAAERSEQRLGAWRGSGLAILVVAAGLLLVLLGGPAP